jgi:hypothetical protein
VGAVPFTRGLPAVLKQLAADKASNTRVSIAEVVSVPNSQTLVVDVGGTHVTVPRLASYAAPVAGEVVYLLVGNSLVLALGTVK